MNSASVHYTHVCLGAKYGKDDNQEEPTPYRMYYREQWSYLLTIIADNTVQNFSPQNTFKIQQTFPFGINYYTKEKSFPLHIICMF